MRVLKALAILLWRIWFYILLVVPIVVMLPVLLVFTSSEKFYPQFFVCARAWAKFILFGMGFRTKVLADQLPEKNKSYMLVANHASMVDIMLMLSVIKQPFVFLGKGAGQNSGFRLFLPKNLYSGGPRKSKSRQEAFNEAQRRLKQQNSVCIFPEGGVPDDETIILDEFKDGAFRLAIEHQIPIVPLTFHDTKKRFSYTFLSGGPGKLRVRIHEFIPTKNLQAADKRELKEKVRGIILQELQHPSL